MPSGGGINRATINFTDPLMTGELVLNVGQVCFPTDLSIESGTVTIPFTVASSSGDYAGATGTGNINGEFSGSLGGGSTLTVNGINSSDFNVPTSTGGSGDVGGGPSPGATPELDSLTLFGSALLGLAGYMSLKRRGRSSAD